MKQLLSRALSKDEEAWESLFRGLYGLVKSRVLRSGLRDEDVEDAISDFLLALISSPEEFLHARDSISYLSASAYFAALRQRKRRSRIAAREESIVSDDTGQPGEHAAARGPDPRDSAISRQVTEGLLAALSRVPEPARRHIVLHYGEDLSYEEIAYIAGSTAGSIRVQVHRALGRVRDHLGETLDISLPGNSLAHAIRAIDLASLEVPPVDGRHGTLLERWILDPGALDPAEREAVENRLDADADFRLLRTLLERRLEKESDVRGHAIEDAIPAALLESLMQHVRRRAGEL